MSKQLSEALLAVCDLHKALNLPSLNKMPDVWAHKVDENWTIVLNGRPETREWDSVKVPPYHCYVEWCGWPAGIFSAGGGVIAAGAAANEETFIAAVRKATEEAKVGATP